MDKISGRGNAEMEVTKRGVAKDPDYREGDRPVDALRRKLASMKEIFEDPNYGYGAGVLAEPEGEFMRALNRLEDAINKLESTKS